MDSKKYQRTVTGVQLSWENFWEVARSTSPDVAHQGHRILVYSEDQIHNSLGGVPQDRLTAVEGNWVLIGPDGKIEILTEEDFEATYVAV